MIFTLTLNPALDISASTPVVEAGPKLRLSAPVYDPGGGGVNVSRAIHAMGGQSTALVALGGASGDQMERMLRLEGVVFERLFAPGDTRQSLAVTEDTTGKQFRFVMPGPDWSDAEVRDVIARIARLMPNGAYLVLSGSQPPGFPADFPMQLCAALDASVQVIVDTSGAALKAVAQGGAAPPAILRMDLAEAEEVAGHRLQGVVETADFAAQLVAQGAGRVIIIARGAKGSVLVSRDTRLFAPAAKVEVISKVGAGDSFVAGFTSVLARGDSLAKALQTGVAAASAAVMTPATALCKAEDVARLKPECEAREI